MELTRVKDLFFHKFKNFQYHNMRFWEGQDGQYYCQANIMNTEKLYGHIFKLNLTDVSYTLHE